VARVERVLGDGVQLEVAPDAPAVAQIERGVRLNRLHLQPADAPHGDAELLAGAQIERRAQ
jgi:hypothetical protein